MGLKLTLRHKLLNPANMKSSSWLSWHICAKVRQREAGLTGHKRRCAAGAGAPSAGREGLGFRGGGLGRH